MSSLDMLAVEHSTGISEDWEWFEERGPKEQFLRELKMLEDRLANLPISEGSAEVDLNQLLMKEMERLWESWREHSLKPDSRPETTVDILKEWEGVVLTVSNDDVQARLTDMNDPANQEELVTFGLDAISPQDHELVEPGAVFYWTVLRETDAFENVRNYSQIRFRRLPAWSRGDLERAETEAEQLHEELFGGRDE